MLTRTLFVVLLLATCGCEKPVLHDEIRVSPRYFGTPQNRTKLLHPLAHCTEIVDARTLKIELGDERMEVRMNGINCPQPGQPYHQEAIELTRALCENQNVHVLLLGRNEARQLLATITTASRPSRTVGQRLVEAGLAWQDPAKNLEYLARAEREAKGQKKGVWSAASSAEASRPSGQCDGSQTSPSPTCPPREARPGAK